MHPADDGNPRSMAVDGHPLRPVVIALLAGLAFSVTTFNFIRQNETQRAETEFNRRVEQQMGLFHEKRDTDEEMLLALRNFQIYAEPVNRREFGGMAGDYLLRHPEIRALQWVPYVPSAQRAVVESEIRQDGFPNFEFTERASDGSSGTAGVRPEHFPVMYVEPMPGNESAFGFDLASDSARRAWLDRARDSGEIVATGRIGLVEYPAQTNGMLVIVPVYHLAPTLPTVELRRQKLAGFVIGIFDLQAMVENTLTRLTAVGINFLLLDNSATPADRVLHYHASREALSAVVSPPRATDLRTGLHREIHVGVGGRNWTFLFQPAPEWLAAQSTWNPYGALMSGLSFTLLLGAHLLAAARRSDLVASLVTQRTAELRESNSRLQDESRERQNAARASGKSAVLLRATLEATGDGILVASADGKIESYNHRFRQMWGLPEEILAAGDDQRAVNYVLDQLKAPAAFIEKVREVYTQTETASFDVLELKDGRIFERYSQAQIIEGAPVGRVWSFRDVTERERAVEALRQSEEQLRNLVETSHDLIWSVDAEGRWVFINAAARHIFGYEPAELLGHAFTELQAPEQAAKDLAVFARIKAGESVFRYETEHRRKDGTPVMLSFNAMVQRDQQGRVLGTTGTATDITARKQREAEQEVMNRKLLETQKLESLGVLAGGIAHDFNNLLTGILGNASLARMDLPELSPLQPLLEQIEIASLRAADLCKQMLAYSGKGRFQAHPLSLNALVEETTELLRISINKKAMLELQLQPDLPAVTADSAQLHQVIMNLVINASEAIGDHPGVITLRTSTVRVDRDFLRQAYLAPDLLAGDYVCLEVRDNGCGMSADIQAKMFDPFFTTKFTGRGLGLAAVLGIVHGHQGALKVYSEPGQGTRFNILLPCVASPAPGPGKPAAATPAWHGTGTVLVVDDEASVREVAALVLKAAGFNVVLAFDGADGVAKFRAAPGEFAAVLMDLTMPHLDGVEAFCEIRKIRADTQVLLMSGFNEHDAVSRFTGKGLAGFIQKPFKIAVLRDKLREILEGAASGRPAARI